MLRKILIPAVCVVAFGLASNRADAQIAFYQRPVVVTTPAVIPAPVIRTPTIIRTSYVAAATPRVVRYTSPVVVSRHSYYSSYPGFVRTARVGYPTILPSRSAYVGPTAFGTAKAYVPGQPVRNMLRFNSP